LILDKRLRLEHILIELYQLDEIEEILDREDVDLEGLKMIDRLLDTITTTKGDNFKA
jgi:hypothetical protein